jgi:hypothetical protein
MTESTTPDTAHHDWILGSWQLLRCDPEIELQPGTRMQFGADHQLEYLIPIPDHPLRVVLRWRVADGVLHTNLDDGSNPVQVGIVLGPAEVLTFDFGGPRAWFVRAR